MPQFPEQVARIIECLESARKRPEMYFGKVAVDPAVHYLNGVDLAAHAWLGDALETRFQVEVERGWRRSAMHPSRQMIERGMTPAEVIEELLIIEIETFRRIAGR